MSARLKAFQGKSIQTPSIQVSAASLLLTGTFLLPLLAGCLNSASLPTATPSPEPATRTPTFTIPTLIPTTTWTPRVPPLATSSFDASMGAIIFEDDFEQDSGWDLGEDIYGATSLTSGRLTLAARQPGLWRFATSPSPGLTDFYVEISLRAEICSSGDEFGLIFRSDPMIGQYRFGLRCEGGVRANRAVGNAVFALVSRDQTNIIVPGPPQENQLAVWASGNQLRFFVNQVETFSVRDNTFTMGSVGVYIHSGNTGQTTVSFDNLIIRGTTPSPTNTPTPDFREEADES